MHEFVGFHLLVLTRIAAALMLGFGLGLERELTNKYAGLRTHILVCLGSCVFTILSIYAFPAAVYGSHGDPARIAAQVLTGIGFIGGGTVLRHGSSVYGLTTAATLWVAASIGMACGAGLIGVAFITALLSVIVLVLIRIFERDVLIGNVKYIKHIKISLSCLSENADSLHNFIVDNFDKISEISKKNNSNQDDIVYIEAIVDVNIKKPVQELYDKFENIEGLKSITIQEHNE